MVAGGGEDVTSVEILSATTLSWRLGPSLPVPLSHASSVSLSETSFLLIGGESKITTNTTKSGRQSDSIYEFKGETQEWIERPEKLHLPLRGMAAILTDSKNVACGTFV